MTAASSGSGSGGGGGWLIGGRYRIVDRIGTGGMAEVFRAHDDVLDRDVAVKVFRSTSTPDTAAGAARQRTELQTLARLTHPNLITLFDGSLGTADDSTAYLVMELIDGATMADAIDRDAVSAAEVRAIGAQIGAALAYVHAANMVHRDVKPANILLGTDATAGTTTVRARLSDFGIVRLIGDARQTGTQFTLGTASYLAPEQARGSSVGPPADVYALGLVLLEALTRTRAFDGPPIEAAMARLQRDPHIPANLPAPWPQLLAAMTDRDPDRRPAAQQIVDVLGQTDAGTTAATTVFAPVPLPSAPPTAATTAMPAGPPPGPVRRSPVHETSSLPPVVVPPRRPAPAAAPARKGLPTLAWLGIAAAAVALIVLVIALLAGNEGGGSPAPGDSSTASTSTAPSSSRSASPSEQSSSSKKHKKRHTRSNSPSRSSSRSTPPSTSSTASSSSSSSSSQTDSPSGSSTSSTG